VAIMIDESNKKSVCFLFDESNDWIRSFVKSMQFDDLEQFKLTETFDAKEAEGFDFVFILGYTKILSESFLLKNKLNLVVHASNLPKGKGFSPVQWQVLNGQNKIPIRLIEAAKMVDSGNVYLQDSFDLTGYELNADIRKKQGNATLKIIRQFLLNYSDINPQCQIGTESFYPRRGVNDSELNIDLPLREQFNLLRVVDNELYPAFFYVEGRKYRLKIEQDEC